MVELDPRVVPRWRAWTGNSDQQPSVILADDVVVLREDRSGSWRGSLE
jgi:hypothetical protein